MSQFIMIVFTPLHASKQDDNTALRAAIKEQHVETVRLLLYAGAEQVELAVSGTRWGRMAVKIFWGELECESRVVC